MTDCCMSPRPEGMTAHTLGCLLSTDHLRHVLRVGTEGDADE